MSIHREAVLSDAAQEMSRKLGVITWPTQVAYVYNPLDYAWSVHQSYIQHFASTPKHTIWLGMNPGPHGMAQTGVPFGEVHAVVEWMKLDGEVGQPQLIHPKRPVTGLSHPRSEVSGRRLWGMFQERYQTAERFFEHHYVINYCPLLFLSADGKNITPDKLPKDIRNRVLEICDAHLQVALDVLEPQCLIGVGKWSEHNCIRNAAQASREIEVHTVLHPSPANPNANPNWAEKACEQLEAQGFSWPGLPN